MGSVVRQGFFSTAITYMGAAIGAFNVLWLYPKVMSLGELGVFRIVQDPVAAYIVKITLILSYRQH